MAMGPLGGVQEESVNVADNTNRPGQGAMHPSKEDWGGIRLHMELRFVPAGVGVVVNGDNTAGVDGRDGEEEDVVIIAAEGNNAMAGPLSLSPSSSISTSPTMLVLSYSPAALLVRPLKPGVGGGIDEMTPNPKEGESNRMCRAISFF